MMDMVPVDFEQGRAPAIISEAVINTKIANQGYQPPASYVAFAIKNGGKRFPSSHRYIRNVDSGETVGVTTIYHYDATLPMYSVDDIWSQTKAELPAGLVPIASSEFAGEICLDFRMSKDRPAVVLYDYEAAPGKEIGKLANSFDDFLSQIGPRPAE